MTVTPKDLIAKNFSPGERLAVFVDGANLSHTLKQLDFSVDWTRLRDFFGGMADLLRCYYYIAAKPEGQLDPLRPMMDFMAKCGGWSVITKPLREQTADHPAKANLDIEIAVDMIRMSAYVDHLVLFSGDGDFRYLVQYLQDHGKRVTIVSSQATQKQVLASDLLKQADHFIELDDLKLHMEHWK